MSAVAANRTIAELLSDVGGEVYDDVATGSPRHADNLRVHELMQALNAEAHSPRPVNLPVLTAGAIKNALLGERFRCAQLLRARAHREAIDAARAGAAAKVYQRHGEAQEFVKNLAAQDICTAAAKLLNEMASELEKEPGT